MGIPQISTCFRFSFHQRYLDLHRLVCKVKWSCGLWMKALEIALLVRVICTTSMLSCTHLHFKLLVRVTCATSMRSCTHLHIKYPIVLDINQDLVEAWEPLCACIITKWSNGQDLTVVIHWIFLIISQLGKKASHGELWILWSVDGSLELAGWVILLDVIKILQRMNCYEVCFSF